MRKAMSFLAGVICGALVGGVAAVLLAPYGGEELRQRIRTQADELVTKGREAAAGKRAELEAQLEAFKQGRPVVLQEGEGTAKS
jgi:gas vesicle protein